MAKSRNASPGAIPASTPFASAKIGGPFLFVSGLFDPAADAKLRLEETPIKKQAGTVFDELSRLCTLHGANAADAAYLMQYFVGRTHTAGYIEARRSVYPALVPTSTGIGCTSLASPDAVLQIDAIVPRAAKAARVVHHAGKNASAGYSHAVSFGDWVFCSGIMASQPQSTAAYPGALGTSLHKDAIVDPNFWFGFPVKRQVQHIVHTKLAEVLKSLEMDLTDVVYAHVHLENPAQDYAPFVEAWRDAFGPKPPLTVVSASNGLGAVGGTVEVTAMALRKGHGLAVEPIRAAMPRAADIGPVARRIGDLVFTATLSAAGPEGLPETAKVPSGIRNLKDSGEAEMLALLERLDAIASAAGGSAADTVRLRLYASDVARMPGAVRACADRLGKAVPLAIVEDGGRPCWVPGATILADAVLHIPRR